MIAASSISLVAQSADLAVNATASPTSVPDGTNLTYTFSVVDQGPNDSAGDVLTTTVPPGSTFQSFTTTNGNCTTPAVGSGGTFQCSRVGNLLSGHSWGPITLVVKVNGTPGSTLTDTVSVSSTTQDPVGSNNSFTTNVPIQAQADLAVSIAANPSPVPNNSQLVYTYSVVNNGPDSSDGDTLTANLPAGTTFQGYTTTNGTCTTPNVGAAGSFQCTRSATLLSAHSWGPITLTLNVDASSTTLTDTATISATTLDSNTTNDSATSTVSVQSEVMLMGMHYHYTTTPPTDTTFALPTDVLRNWDMAYSTWAGIQPSSPTSYNWSSLDYWLNKLEAATPKGQLLFNLGRPASWATKSTDTNCGTSTPGSCHPPYDIDSANACAAPATGTGNCIWKTWVYNVIAHVKSVAPDVFIHFEVWNEPNANYWLPNNDYAHMVRLQTDAYNVIHANCDHCDLHSPAPQGSSAQTWMGAYLAAGGNKNVDAIDWHPYGSNTPEARIGYVDNMKSVMSSNGVGSKSLWATEWYWSNCTGMNDDTEAAFLARTFIVLDWKGVAGAIWYAYEDNMFDNGPATCGVTYSGQHKDAIAYKQVYSWLKGNTASCTNSGTVYSCAVSRPTDSSYNGKIQWDTSSTTTRSWSATGFTQWRQIDASTIHPTNGAASITPTTTGNKPIILENK